MASLAQRAADQQDRETDRLVAERDAQVLRANIAALFAETTEVAARAADGRDAFLAAARRAVADGPAPTIAFLDAEGTVLALEGPSIARLAGQADLRDEATFAEALDAVAATVEAVGVPDEDHDTLLVIAPVIPAGAEQGLAARRAARTGAVAAALPVEQLRSGLRAGTVLRLQADVTAVGDPIDDPIVTTSLRAGPDVWTLELQAPERSRSRSGVTAGIIGLLVTAVLTVALRRQHAHRQRAERVAADRARQLAMIAGTSAALHRSLDLADVLPAFCVEVSEEYDLTSLTVQLADDEGALGMAFRYGPSSAGILQSFELRRGVRTVGRLDARSALPIDPVDARSMQALADLLAVAISNAELYLREQQAVSRLNELDAMRNAFLGTVSHELRTSTTAVQGFAELLVEHWETFPEERRRELSTRIRRQAASLRHLVDDLLDYARLEQRQLRVQPREVDLGLLARQISESMTPLLAQHDLVIDVADGVTAWADPHAVERILANLLSNAGKYAPPGTRVTVTVCQAGDKARLSVADQGPGIPADERRRVFTRFYRRSNPETLRTRGAGIGLSILSDFAATSGATVAVSDAPGGGAVLTVDFPTAATEQEAETQAQPQEGQS